MSLGGRTFVVRVVDVVSATSGRGVVEVVASGDSAAFTSGQQLLDIVFSAGGPEDDVDIHTED